MSVVNMSEDWKIQDRADLIQGWVSQEARRKMHEHYVQSVRDRLEKQFSKTLPESVRELVWEAVRKNVQTNTRNLTVEKHYEQISNIASTAFQVGKSAGD